MRQILFSAFLLFSINVQAQEPVMNFYEKPIPVPMLTWQDSEGKTFSIESFKGKVVLLNLWATWCKPCMIEMPAFNFLQKRYRAGGFEVVPIAIQDDAQKIPPFMEQNRLDELTAYIDSSDMVGKAFRPKVMPTTYLINRKGQIIAGKEGLSDWLGADMMSLIETELKKDQKEFHLPKGMKVIDRNDVHGGVRF